MALLVNIGFPENARDIYGACALNRAEITGVQFPSSSREARRLGAGSSETPSGFLVYSTIRQGSITGMPTGSARYAIEYVINTRTIDMRELGEMLNYFYARLLEPMSVEKRAQFLGARLTELTDSSWPQYHSRVEFGDVTVEQGVAYRREQHFVRWVEKEEFEKAVHHARMDQCPGISYATSWEARLDHRARALTCQDCQLNSIRKQRSPGCVESIAMERWLDFAAFLRTYGGATLPIFTRIADRIGVRILASEADPLRAESIELKKLLHTHKIPALELLGFNGQLIQTLPCYPRRAHWFGDTKNAYCVGIEPGMEQISVVLGTRNLFDLSPTDRRALISRGGKQGIANIESALLDHLPRRYFSEIVRDRHLIFGLRGPGGRHLFRLEASNMTFADPFLAFNQSDQLARIRFSKVLAAEAFAGICEALSRSAMISHEYNLDIDIWPD